LNKAHGLEKQIKILEEIALLVGLSQQEIMALLSILKKSSSGRLTFIRDNFEVTFDSCNLLRDLERELNLGKLNDSVTVELVVDRKHYARKTKYNISDNLISNSLFETLQEG
jgi:hypothetical protein